MADSSPRWIHRDTEQVLHSQLLSTVVWCLIAKHWLLINAPFASYIRLYQRRPSPKYAICVLCSFYFSIMFVVFLFTMEIHKYTTAIVNMHVSYSPLKFR